MMESDYMLFLSFMMHHVRYDNRDRNCDLYHKLLPCLSQKTGNTTSLAPFKEGQEMVSLGYKRNIREHAVGDVKTKNVKYVQTTLTYLNPMLEMYQTLVHM